MNLDVGFKFVKVTLSQPDTPGSMKVEYKLERKASSGVMIEEDGTAFAIPEQGILELDIALEIKMAKSIHVFDLTSLLKVSHMIQGEASLPAVQKKIIEFISKDSYILCNPHLKVLVHSLPDHYRAEAIIKLIPRVVDR